MSEANSSYNYDKDKLEGQEQGMAPELKTSSIIYRICVLLGENFFKGRTT